MLATLEYLVVLIVVVILVIVLLKFLFGVLFLAPMGLEDIHAQFIQAIPPTLVS